VACHAFLDQAPRPLGTVPPEWTEADWCNLAEDGLAATDEVHHQRWLVEQWRDWARADGS